MAHTITTTADVLAYYRQQTQTSDPGQHESCYNGLPDDIHALCRVVHHAILHIFWISKTNYGLDLEQLKAAGRDLSAEFTDSTLEDRLDTLLALDPRPLVEPRDPSHRSVGCCRDFALLLASILRHRGIPARVRTGVARYFRHEGHPLIEDHYVTEHWNGDEHRWQLTDPQIDDVQRPTIDSNVDPVDLPEDAFLTARRLHAAIVAGTVPAEKVGFPPVNVGLTYARNKIFADFLSVTGLELPVHASWGLGDPHQDDPEDAALVQEMLRLLRGIDRNEPEALSEALCLAHTHPRIRRPTGYRVPSWHWPGVC